MADGVAEGREGVGARRLEADEAPSLVLAVDDDVAVGRGGNVYVADSLNHRIQMFDRDGNLLLKWGTFCKISNGTGCEEAPVARGVSTQVAVNTVVAMREDGGGFNGDRDTIAWTYVSLSGSAGRSPPPTNRADSGDFGRPDLSIVMHRGW